MTGKTELLYWQSNDDWYEYNQETREYKVKENAPERAKKSFELYIEYYNEWE